MLDRKMVLATLVTGAMLLPGAAFASSASVGTSSGSGSSVAVGSGSDGTSTVIINGRPCKVVTEKGGGSGDGSQSSPVTAGGGSVSGSTTMPNGSSVTVDPGGSTATTSGSGSSGNCVILRSPGSGK